MLRGREITERLRDIRDFLLEEYKQSEEEERRDWRTYEQRLTCRLKKAIRNIEPLIDQAVSTIKVHREKGRRPVLTLKQKVILLLLKELCGKSNRMTNAMVVLFSLLSGIDVSYKTIERLYSDAEVEIALHNLHVLILKKKGVENVDASGDGTGYSLTIKKHYASEVENRKDEVKEAENEKKSFVYSFKLLDLNTRMYVAYGVSFKSEKQAFEKAMKFLEEVEDAEIKIGSVRLDRYYSFPSYADRFGEAVVYVMPRKNSTLRGSWKWKRIMIQFVNDTIPYLGQYYRRCNSESEISVDKRWFGWKIEQRREDRINAAVACTTIWHNLFNLYST